LENTLAMASSVSNFFFTIWQENPPPRTPILHMLQIINKQPNSCRLWPPHYPRPKMVTNSFGNKSSCSQWEGSACPREKTNFSL
jgi:hypothetical protein